MKPIALHWKILIGMILGVIFGFAMLQFDGGAQFVNNLIKPLNDLSVLILIIDFSFIKFLISGSR